MNTFRIFAADICHLLDDPQKSTDAFQSISNGALVVNKGGIIVECTTQEDARQKYPEAEWVQFENHLILPGFIDCHTHFPQMNIVGSYGEELLGWLNKYTFPAEIQFVRSPSLANMIAMKFINKLVSNGTTSMVVFSTSDFEATNTFFEVADTMGIRVISGKTGMDRNAPSELLVSPEEEYEQNCELIKRWNGRSNRLYYALSPRFAPTSSPELLSTYQKLKHQFPSLYLQTHLAENQNEVEWVKELYPDSKNYFDVYDQYNLTGPKSIFAHSIFNPPEALERFEQSGSIVAHCPSANLFLGSGLFPLDEYQEKNIPITLGTDIGAGTTFSLWQLMSEAYKVQKLRGQSVSPIDWLYLATLGAAKTLGWSHIGNFEKGKEADFQVVNCEIPTNISENEKSDLLFPLMNLADDRNIDSVYVKGKRIVTT